MTDAPALPEISVSEQFCAWAALLRAEDVPDPVRQALSSALLDFAGICVSARGLNYVAAMRVSCDAAGDCTAIGHAGGFDAAGAALINGTAAHGEDYDDTFEGTPIHCGAVILPAVLAAGERHGYSGQDALRGMAVGTELMCRMALIARTGVHKAGFHPTAVIGALGAAAAVGAALKLNPRQMTDALGVAGSFASGIIEYLAEGSWTKRLHTGWAAQGGIRAAVLGREGFLGPRTVLEGSHGFFHAFTDGTITPDFSLLIDGLGAQWHAANLAFKPYACGTMTQPFIDCAIRLGRDGLDPATVERIECEVGEGTVHRLWEPLAEKRRPSTPYSAKFSVPFCIAVGMIDGAAGLGQFTDSRVSDPAVLDLAGRVAYVIDPDNDYPRNYSGHIKVVLKDGSEVEVRQPHMRGGTHEPLDAAELAAKFHANTNFGGWPEDRARALREFCATLFDAPDLTGLAAFRG